MNLSAGQEGDGPHGRELLKSFEPGEVEHVVADAAYDGDETRRQVRTLKAKACIKPHSNRKTKKRYNKTRYKNFFCQFLKKPTLNLKRTHRVGRDFLTFGFLVLSSWAWLTFTSQKTTT